MGNILVSPAEPPRLRSLGTVSSVTETFGADYLWTSKALDGLVGVQRKEISDLISSVRDGRLAKEVSQLNRVAYACLMVEGEPRWTNDGALVTNYDRWTRHQHRSLLRSIQGRHIEVVSTDNMTDTVTAILELRQYLESPSHNSLDRRPMVRGAWGSPTAKDYGMHVLQSAPGIGPGIAAAIFEHFGGVPIGWTCEREDLLEVPGIGPGRVEKLWRSFAGVAGGDGDGDDDDDDDV
jgi:ERCC4-type nuclease